MRNMKFAAAAVFALLCVTGLATMGNGERLEEWQTAARQLMENMSRKQLPDVVEVSNGSAQVGTIVAEEQIGVKRYITEYEETRETDERN